jgi:hypothetical protein
MRMDPSRARVSSVASRVMGALRSLDTGQPAFALPTSSSNRAWSAAGILAFKVRWTAVMGPGSK